jgi:GH25 family lysozyme M1 (1,4-beta-N-acetylmuramidase)
VLTLTSRPHRNALVPIALVAILLATTLFAVASIAAPSQALGASTFKVKCSTGLRTKPSFSSTRKAVIPEGTQVYAVTMVSGGSWKLSCDGRTYRGNSWYKISNVNGRSANSRYGVSYVYAATAMFSKATLYKRYAKCNDVSLRSLPSTSAGRVGQIDTGKTVLVLSRVTGGSWSTRCAGDSASGNTWYRIAFVGSTSSKERYGVTYVYAATSLLVSSPPATSETPTSSPTPTPTPKPAATPTPTPTPKRLEGIDVSHWQGTIDWGKVRGAGKKFAFIKASEHTSFVDDKYQTNRANAKSAGLKVGAYHFARPNLGTTDAYAEADHFIETADWTSGELRPVLDLEDTGGLSSSALQTWVKAFVQRVYAQTGVRAIIYVSPAFWSSKMGNSRWFADNGYDVLWIAHWTTASSPSVPAENWGGKSWTFWQYTSSGSVSGISGRVDLDRFNGSDLSKVLIP